MKKLSYGAKVLNGRWSEERRIETSTVTVATVASDQAFVDEEVHFVRHHRRENVKRVVARWTHEEFVDHASAAPNMACRYAQAHAGLSGSQLRVVP